MEADLRRRLQARPGRAGRRVVRHADHRPAAELRATPSTTTPTTARRRSTSRCAAAARSRSTASASRSTPTTGPRRVRHQAQGLAGRPTGSASSSSAASPARSTRRPSTELGEPDPMAAKLGSQAASRSAPSSSCALLALLARRPRRRRADRGRRRRDRSSSTATSRSSAARRSRASSSSTATPASRAGSKATSSSLAGDAIVAGRIDGNLVDDRRPCPPVAEGQRRRRPDLRRRAAAGRSHRDGRGEIEKEDWADSLDLFRSSAPSSSGWR